MSLRAVTSRPRSCSGDMKDGVPERTSSPSSVSARGAGAEAGIRPLPRDPHLAEEALEALTALFELLGQELERHRVLELEVVGAVDLDHAAPAEEAEDAVALGHHGAGRDTLGGWPPGG